MIAPAVGCLPGSPRCPLLPLARALQGGQGRELEGAGAGAETETGGGVVAVVEGCKAVAWPWPLVILHAMCEREEVVAGVR